MDIQLSDRYKISTDQRNYILKIKTKKGKWRDLGYYGKYGHLVNALLEREIKHSEVEDLESVQKLIKQVENSIVNNLIRIEKKIDSEGGYRSV